MCPSDFPPRFTRTVIPVRPSPVDANIVPHYHLESTADWIWCAAPERPSGVVRFVLDFELARETTTLLHVSADARFELRLDGDLVGRGPDRSDPAHWAFSSYAIEFTPGWHRIEAWVVAFGELNPGAQMSVRPGFVLSAEGLEKLLNTGEGNWLAGWLNGVEMGRTPILRDHDVGPEFVLRAPACFEPRFTAVRVVQRRIVGNPYGLVMPGPRLHSSGLPDQLSQWIDLGEPVAGRRAEDGEARRWDEADRRFDRLREWRKIPPESAEEYLFFLPNYYCGWPELDLSGGAGARVALEWAEALVDEPDHLSTAKGKRSRWEGKYFRGFGDRFFPDGEERKFRPFWWRAGRYVRLRIETAMDALVIHRIRFEETRYPFDESTAISVEDEALMEVLPAMIRGLEVCAHEIFVDCPFYEQLSYVGDARLQALCWLVMQRDDRLLKRNLEVFDWSRRENGFVAERYPGNTPQVSVTYAMIWILMVKDFAWWRDEAAFVRGFLPGIRSLIEELLRLRGPSGLLEKCPGWSFVDWTDPWILGTPPGARADASATLDLTLVLALQAAEELEKTYGEPECAARYGRLARSHAELTQRTFWEAERGLYADDREHTAWSVHAQALAILAGLPQVIERGQTLLGRTVGDPQFAQSSVYFDFYVLEALYRIRDAQGFMQCLGRFESWRENGLATPPEKADPSRSDCHAWGSHPVYHARSCLLGVRPTSAGFATVGIEPLGPWRGVRRGEIPHPRGKISLHLESDGRQVSGWVELPPGTSGTLRLGSTVMELSAAARVTFDPISF